MKRILIAAALAASATAGWAGMHMAGAEAAAPAAIRHAEVWKSESCGCCSGWIAYLEQRGFDVTVHVEDDVEPIKDQAGVPAEMRSCHTARIGGYVVEGHVPVEAIDKLLADKPKVTGIAAPGMPSGSPGMSGPKAPNPVYSFGGKGKPQVVGVY